MGFYSLSVSQVRIDTAWIEGIQNDIEHISMDSLEYPCYSNRYRSYLRDLIEIEKAYFLDSTRNDSLYPMIEWCDRLKSDIYGLFFDAGKYRSNFEDVYILRNDTIFRLMVSDKNDTISVRFCDTNIHLYHNYWLQVSNCIDYVDIIRFTKTHSSPVFKKILKIPIVADREMKIDWDHYVRFYEKRLIELYIKDGRYKKVLKKYLQLYCP